MGLEFFETQLFFYSAFRRPSQRHRDQAILTREIQVFNACLRNLFFLNKPSAAMTKVNQVYTIVQPTTLRVNSDSLFSLAERVDSIAHSGVHRIPSTWRQRMNSSRSLSRLRFSNIIRVKRGRQMERGLE